MPAYKNRLPLDPATKLWRYITLDGLVDILRNGRLRLTRVDKFDDGAFEGSVPKRQIDDQTAILSSWNAVQTMTRIVAAYHQSMSISMPPKPHLDRGTEMTRWRRAKTRSAHASCWTAGDESEAMWRLYCQDGRGVALQSTLEKIEASVACHGLFVSPIRYRYYHEGDAFNDELDPFMHKRKGFVHEGEVRLLKYDENHYVDLADALTSGDPAREAPPELDKHIFLDWSPAEVIEKITISPYADDSYEKKAREEIASVDLSLVGRLELSVLSERRYAPHF